MTVSRFFTLSCAASFLLLAACHHNQQLLPGKPSLTVDEAIWRSHIATLSSDAFLGRAPGTEGEVITLDYLEKELIKLGCRPPFAGSFRQAVPLISRSPGIQEILELNSDSKHMLLPRDQWVWTNPLPQNAITLNAAPVIWAGFGIVAPKYNWNDYEGLDIRGKLVVALESDPAQTGGETPFFTGQAVNAYARLAHKWEEASRRGAVGLLLVDPRPQNRSKWDQSRKARQLPPMFIDDARYPKGFIIAYISWSAASQLMNLAGLDLEQEYSRAQKSGFLGQALPLSASFTGHSPINRFISHNIAGLIPGENRPQETVIVSAHWDHLGVGSPLNGDSIYNGACDNAVGLSTALEMARIFSSTDLQLDRSLMLLMPTAEEKLLLGSDFFVSHPPSPLGDFIANINIDGLFPLGPMKDIGVIGTGLSSLDSLLQREAARQGRTITPDQALEQGYFYRLDLFNFVKSGVPGLHIGTGNRPVDETETQSIKEKLGSFYHQPFDEYRPDIWNIQGMMADIEVINHMVFHLCRAAERPRFIPGRDYREIRHEPK